MTELAVFVWYMIGAHLHVGWRWSGWRHNNREKAWRDYWKNHLAMNVKALIVAVVVAAFWTNQELLVWALGLTGIEALKSLPTIQQTPLASVSAGFIFEYLAARVAARWSKE